VLTVVVRLFKTSVGLIFRTPSKMVLFLFAMGYMGVGTGGAEGAAAPPTFGTGEQAIALAPPKV